MAGGSTAASARQIVWQVGTDNGGRLGDGVATGAPALVPDRTRPRSVLVVDDETQIVDFLCLLLEDEGFRVLRAYDGAQAWELIRARHDPPDLVITDVMMPRMSGLQLAQRLKESYNGTCPPVVVMSAVTEVGQAPRMRFLPKPFDIDRLLDLVAELIER